jgi:hypothetical protein
MSVPLQDLTSPTAGSRPPPRGTAVPTAAPPSPVTEIYDLYEAYFAEVAAQAPGSPSRTPASEAFEDAPDDAPDEASRDAAPGMGWMLPQHGPGRPRASRPQASRWAWRAPARAARA